MKPPNAELDSKSGLARRLDMTRTTLDAYLNQDGAPKPVRGRLYSVSEVTAYVQANAKSDRTAAKTDETLIGLKRRRLGIQCEREQIALEVARGKLVPKEQIQSDDTQIHTAIKLLLYRKMVVELAEKLYGLSVEDIKERLRTEYLEILRLLRAPETWESPKSD